MQPSVLTGGQRFAGAGRESAGQFALVREAECFDGHIWMPTVSSDGVAVMVSRLRQRALMTGQWIKAAA
jgi:hypothetical protein